MISSPWRHAVVVCALLLCGLTLFPPPALATQVPYRTIGSLGSESPVVVRGEVSQVRTYWNDARTRILTEVSVRVSESYKGAPAGEVRIVQMGGELDGVRMTVAGSLEWNRGEDVVLFLEESLPGRYRVAGFSQGRFDVQRDPRTGEEFVVQSRIGEAQLVESAARGATSARLTLRGLLAEALPEIQEGE